MLINTTISTLKNKYYHLVQGSGNTPSEYGSVRHVFDKKYTCLLGTCSCDNVVVSDFLKIFYFDISGRRLRLHIGSLQWGSISSDSLPLCLGYFSPSHRKIVCTEE